MTTHPDEQAFRAAIRERPAERTTRLAFADYLDDADRPVDAALARVLAEPAEDRHRLAYADACEQPRTVRCWRCKGSGYRYRSHNSAADVRCSECGATGSLPTHPDAARAEFVRVQVELAQMPAPPRLLRPASTDFEPADELRRSLRGPPVRQRVRESPSAAYLTFAPGHPPIRTGEAVDIDLSVVPQEVRLLHGGLVERVDANAGGEPWGVRVVFAAADPYREHSGRYDALRLRQRQLWETAGRPLLVDWGFAIPGRYVVLTPVPGDDFGLGNGDVEGVFRRGFVESVTLSAADWLAHGDAILEAHPVTSVRLTGEPALHVHRGRVYSLPGRDEVESRREGEGWGGVCLRLLRRGWPDLAFELRPPA